MRRLPLVLAVVLGLLAAVSLASAQAGVLELNWFSIEGGGTTSASAGALQLSGTIGQPDAWAASSGTLLLAGGLWGVTYPSSSVVYLPMVLK